MSALSTAVSFLYPLASLGVACLTVAAVKGVEELVNKFTAHGRDAGYLACMIAILYFLTIYRLKKLGSSTFARPSFRGFLADYAYPVGFSLSLSLSLIRANIVSSALSFGLVLRTFRIIRSRLTLGSFLSLVLSILRKIVAG